MRYKILLGLFILSLLSSLILSFTPVSEICDPGEGCDVVHYSPYNYTFGVQNSHYGIAIFTIMILLTLWQIKKPRKFKEKIISISVAVGSLIAIYFIYIQHSILQAYCKYCLVVDFSMLVSLIVLLYYKFKKKDFPTIPKELLHIPQ